MVLADIYVIIIHTEILKIKFHQPMRIIIRDNSIVLMVSLHLKVSGGK